jgi:hypothetical protein
MGIKELRAKAKKAKATKSKPKKSNFFGGINTSGGSGGGGKNKKDKKINPIKTDSKNIPSAPGGEGVSDKELKKAVQTMLTQKGMKKDIFGKELSYINDLKNAGYSEKQIADMQKKASLATTVGNKSSARKYLEELGNTLNTPVSQRGLSETALANLKGSDLSVPFYIDNIKKGLDQAGNKINIDPDVSKSFVIDRPRTGLDAFLNTNFSKLPSVAGVFTGGLNSLFGSSDYQQRMQFFKDQGLTGDALKNATMASLQEPLGTGIENLEAFKSQVDQNKMLNQFDANPNLIAPNAFADFDRNDSQSSDPCPPGFQMVNGSCQPVAGGSNTDPGTQQTMDSTDLITYYDPNQKKYVSGTYADYQPFAQVKDGGIMNARAGKFVSAGNSMKDTIIDAIRRSVANGRMSPEAGERAIRQIELGPQPKQQDLFKYEGGIIQNFANGDEVSVPDLNMFNPSGTNRVANPGGMPYMDRETDENLSMEDLAEDRAAMKDLAPESGITKLLDRLQTEADIASDVNESREFMNTPEPLYKNVLDTRTGQLKRVDVNDPGVRESIMKRELIPFEENMPAPRMEDIDFKDPQGRGDYNLEEPIYRMQEGMPEDLQQMKPFILNPTPDYTDRPITGIDTPDNHRMLEAAEGGIIGLGHGGMSNPMDMQAMDGMMFKDPEDGEEWEYNV